MKEKQKNKLGLGIIIGVLIGFILGLCCFIAYDKLIVKDKNDTIMDDNNASDKKNNSDSQEEKFTGVSLSDDVVKKLLSSILVEEKDGLLLTSDFQYELYKTVNSFTLVNNFSDSIKFRLVFANISDEIKSEYSTFVTCGSKYVIPSNIINNIALNIFGSSYTLSKPIDKLSLSNGVHVTFDSQNDTYIFEGCGSLSHSIGSVRTKIVKAIKSDNELIIEEQVNFLEVENVEDNLSVGVNTYKYTFKKNNDDSYYFYSVEKIS